jgi:hypothetical protein
MISAVQKSFKENYRIFFKKSFRKKEKGEEKKNAGLKPRDDAFKDPGVTLK